MTTSKACVSCGSDQITSASLAVVAPWVLGVSHPNSNRLDSCLLYCCDCGLQFFSRRYTPEELSAFYTDYRGPSYVARRRSWEPWYSSRRNDRIGHDENVEHVRNTTVKTFISQHLGQSPLRIVDYGGDEGQFIPDLDNIEYSGVFDVSGRPLREGIAILRSNEEIKAASPNLIMLCHVLEHLTEPREELSRILEVLSDHGSLYVEVPLDAHRVRSATPTILVRLFRSGRLPFVVADFISQISRFKFGWRSRFRLIKQSEHLQFFSANSLSVLAKILGLTTIAFHRYQPDSAIGTPETLGVLFEKT